MSLISSRNLSNSTKKKLQFGREYGSREKAASVYELQYSVYINEAKANIIEAWELHQFRQHENTKDNELTLPSRDFE
jgi:hypothetical protein